MDILVTGSTGLLGSTLTPILTAGGHHVTRLVRSTPRPGEAEVEWNPATGSIATPGLEGLDVVVHLAGENIATGRWTHEKKVKIRHSRVQGTRILCEALAQLANPPKVLVSASAIGYYGDRGDDMLRETSRPGTDFLAHVCRDWEAATAPAAQRGIRVVHLRIGVILSRAGGALAKMLGPFTMGVGGVVGSGQQYMSWIAIDDVIGAIHHVLITESLQGPVNVVAPQAVTNREFTKTLGRVLVRPTLFPMPAFAARALFGDMADALLLASTRVEPARLQETGYEFRYPDLEGALRHLLRKKQAA
ncbi:MAG: TIGR01777 family oxidoreductase [Candidatus Tectomicrobia bacterium]